MRWFSRKKKRFDLHIFFPDGGDAESGEKVIAELSPRWLGICSAILADYGPVLRHNMGSTLSDFEIRMAGPIGELVAFETTCFDFAISLGRGNEQDVATAAHFRRLLDAASAVTREQFSTRALAIVDGAASRPSLLLFDRVIPGIDDEDKGALLELGTHLAAAYIDRADA